MREVAPPVEVRVCLANGQPLPPDVTLSEPMIARLADLLLSADAEDRQADQAEHTEGEQKGGATA